MSTISLVGLDKAAVLAALYNASKPQGMGFLRYVPEPMTKGQAEELLSQQTRFDYLQGRVMKVNLSGDEFDPWGYDRYNGQGAAQRAIDGIGDNESLAEIHVSATRSSAEELKGKIGTPITRRKVGDITVFDLGMPDPDGRLAEAVDDILKE
jgi:hypothetical protein